MMNLQNIINRVAARNLMDDFAEDVADLSRTSNVSWKVKKAGPAWFVLNGDAKSDDVEFKVEAELRGSDMAVTVTRSYLFMGEAQKFGPKKFRDVENTGPAPVAKYIKSVLKSR